MSQTDVNHHWEEVARIHYRGDDGWMHCPDEYQAIAVDLPAMVAVRCPHFVHPFRYVMVEAATGTPEAA